MDSQEALRSKETTLDVYEAFIDLVEGLDPEYMAEEAVKRETDTWFVATKYGPAIERQSMKAWIDYNTDSLIPAEQKADAIRKVLNLSVKHGLISPKRAAVVDGKFIRVHVLHDLGQDGLEDLRNDIRAYRREIAGQLKTFEWSAEL